MNARRLKMLLDDKFVNKNKQNKPIEDKPIINYIPSLNVKEDNNAN